MKNYQHLFGPVQSRRLGRSLGIDLVKAKTCSLDCVYCECGATTCLTTERKVFIQTHEVMAELTAYLNAGNEIDCITFSGAGEPTLAKNLGEVITEIKKLFPKYTLCLLTNGTLFTSPQLRQEVLPCDIIVPSLDAVSDGVFNKINRPAKELNNSKIINGLLELSKEYTGKIWLEIFIVPGLNDTPEELTLLKKYAGELNAEKIQLNSLDRHGAEKWVNPATRKELEQIADFFKPLAVDIVARNTPDNTPLRQATR